MTIDDLIARATKSAGEPITTAQIRRCLLDFAAACAAGRSAPAAARMRAYACGKGAADRALRLSSCAAALDCDDGCMGAAGHLGHPGSAVIPAALAAGSGGRFFAAIAAGYAVYLRAAELLQRPDLGRFVTAGTPAAYGAAAAAGVALELDAAQLRHAIGIAEMHAPASQLGRASSSAETKEAVPWGTFSGVHAALLAASGMSGPASIFDEGADAVPAQASILSVYFKPYCGCRFAHAALDALGEILSQARFSDTDVKRVVIGVVRGAARLSERRPRTLEAAQYSIPFLAAVLAVFGRVTPAEMRTETLVDPRVLAFADKVELGVDGEADASRFSAFGALVTVESIGGAWHQRRKQGPRGEPAEPLSDTELEAKFKLWALPVVGGDRIARITTEVGLFDPLRTAAALIDVLDE